VPPHTAAAVAGTKTATAGASLLRSPRFQRHSDRLGEALLMVVSPTQSVAAVAVAAAKVTAATAEASE